ncbi:hypothetical protein RHGRI_007513 [Rhododendron griersonianum]|uniref:Uncharacterized protein n=1 Tax=Rhododendron griersonianum TaxID=479676 RepID=A0AAV6KX98_9ERIC|nr:hypothetical protein RHGRI_007513 [Rhododendron griersonianum]
MEDLYWRYGASASADRGSKLGSFPTSEPIAERFGVGYPFPPHLEHAYPTLDRNILTNNENALIARPRFYTQVFHLMNKMNIPAPLCIALPTPPPPPSAGVPALPSSPPPPPPPLANKPSSTDLSSGESELESSDEISFPEMLIVWSQLSFRKLMIRHILLERIKRESIVGLADVAHEAVGVRPTSLVPKEIPVITKKNPLLQVISVCFERSSEWANRSSEVEKEQTEPDENLDLKPYLTPDELEGGKLPPEEILSLPMFKNYATRNPASVLYIKNLVKDVVADDFYFIFGEDWGGLSNRATGNL